MTWNSVCILETLLMEEQQAKDTDEAILEQFDTMKKPSHAFCGEFGVNRLAEESAMVLLKTIF